MVGLKDLKVETGMENSYTIDFARDALIISITIADLRVIRASGADLFQSTRFNSMLIILTETAEMMIPKTFRHCARIAIG